MANKRKKVYTNGEHPNIEGVLTPDGYKSQALDVIAKRQEDGPAGRPIAPPDYVFPAEDSNLQIITARSGGNNVVSQVIQIDNRVFRVLWSRYQEETAEINKEQKTELQAALDWQLEKIKPQIRDDGSAGSLTRIGAFFLILGELIDRQRSARPRSPIFWKAPLRSSVKKKISGLLTRWQDIARG